MTADVARAEGAGGVDGAQRRRFPYFISVSPSSRTAAAAARELRRIEVRLDPANTAEMTVRLASEEPAKAV